ncbi:hybrid sensor histidine kinase/response regulator [Haloarcula nitratireducens]|uniref:histidine kinase n=1 Tax=Haloarcula nitratireducens TaxID=2487749 RepID=A0AAW4PJY6_9EURY|nr:PAS domain S-box protein [Halomicroarcula nitratireducens]MBX0298298.1 PAS domain S-box protein [Halomicroarcula nitratireducens]
MSTGFSDTIRVLHIDDEPDFAELTSEFLERTDDRLIVESAATVRDGLERLAHGSFDCLVSDYDMPGQTGIEFLETVREDDPDLPFILFTGKGSEEVASEAISAGVTDYLQKEGGTDQYAVLANRITNAVGHYRSRQLVERSETRLREIVDSLPHPLYVVDEEGQLLLANETQAAIHDLSVDELEGTHVTDVLDGPAAKQLRDAIADVVETGTATRIAALDVPDADGERHVYESRLLPYDIVDTDKQAVLGIATDITDRRQRECELEQTRERMQLALAETDSIIFEIDCATDEVVRHGAYSDFFDLESGDAPTWTEHLTQVVHPDDRDEFIRFYRQLTAGDRDRGELEYRTDPELGSVNWIRDTVFIEEGDDRDARQVLGIARDVTDHKERELELQRAERQYQAIFHDPNILVGLIDTDGTVLDINETAMDYVEMLHEDVIGMPFWETAWFDHSASLQEEVKTWVDRAMDGEYVEFETDLVRPTGEPYTVEGVFRPVTNDDGEVVSLIISDREVTEQKEYERVLERTNALLSTLFETLPIGVIAEDEERNVVAINEQLVDLFDFPGTPDELRGADCTRLVEEVSDMVVDPDGFVEQIDHLVAECGPVRNDEVALQDGRTFSWSYHPIELPEEAGHLWVYRDITAQKTREDRLAALNETTRELMAADTREAVAEIGVQAARNILGMDANAIHLYDDERAALVPVAASAAGQELVGDPPTFTGGDSIAWRVYESGEALALDDVHEDPDIYNLDSPVQSEYHLPLGERGILIACSDESEAFAQHDIVLGEILASNVATALGQVEQTEQLREREQELTRQNDRLEEFASVVSHDLQNPLQVAEGRLKLVQEECESEHLDAIERALSRMDALIENLLTLAREGNRVQELAVLELSTLATNCWQNVDTADATLQPNTEQIIRADEGQLKQLLENLIRNAVEHGGDDVTVTIGDLRDGFYVADDGPGIPPAERDAVFEAGYSTSDTGTGFGLRIVKQVVEAHGWEMTITESDAGGAQVELTSLSV